MRAITVDGPGVPQPGRQRVVGAGRRASPRASAYLRLLGEAGLQRGGCVAADQFPVRRRRRPVHDDRQDARGAPAVGAGRRGGRRARRGRRHGARRHVAADDGAARSVGEHAAHHARRVRRRRRRRRHRAGAPVRRGDPRRIARHWRPVSRAASPATPSCCCSRSPISAGCSTPRAGRGSSRTSPSSSPSRRWAHFQDIEASGGFADGRRLRRRADRRGGRDRAPTTSRTAAPRSPVSTNIPNLAEAALPQP